MPIYAKRVKLARENPGGAVTAIDFTSAARKLVKISANSVPTVSGGSEGEELTLVLQQDGTGSRLVTWPANVVWIGGSAPTLATGAYDVNIIKFIKVGSSYIAQSVGAAAFAADL